MMLAIRWQLALHFGGTQEAVLTQTLWKWRAGFPPILNKNSLFFFREAEASPCVMGSKQGKQASWHLSKIHLWKPRVLVKDHLLFHFHVRLLG